MSGRKINKKAVLSRRTLIGKCRAVLQSHLKTTTYQRLTIHLRLPFVPIYTITQSHLRGLTSSARSLRPSVAYPTIVPASKVDGRVRREPATSTTGSSRGQTLIESGSDRTDGAHRVGGKVPHVVACSHFRAVGIDYDFHWPRSKLYVMVLSVFINIDP